MECRSGIPNHLFANSEVIEEVEVRQRSSNLRKPQTLISLIPSQVRPLLLSHSRPEVYNMPTSSLRAQPVVQDAGTKKRNRRKSLHLRQL